MEQSTLKVLGLESAVDAFSFLTSFLHYLDLDMLPEEVLNKLKEFSVLLHVELENLERQL